MAIGKQYSENIEELLAACKERWYYCNGELISKRIGKPVGAKNPKNPYRTVDVRQGGMLIHLRLHRAIFLMHHGYLPETVDHINGDTSDNHIENLRAASCAENSRNTKRTTRNKSGYKGVVYEKRLGAKPYVVYIKINGQQTRQGNYATPEEAHEVYKRVAAEAFGEFARFG
jgi:hypothetical protein